MSVRGVRGRMGVLFVVLLVAIMVGVVIFVTGIVRDMRSPSGLRTFAEQIDEVPGVVDVHWESTSPGSGVSPRAGRPIDSTLVLAPEVLGDPEPTAQALSTILFHTSTWRVEGQESELNVRLAQPDARITTWWLSSVDALTRAEPGSALDCTASAGGLECTVRNASPERAAEALSEIDATGLAAWLERAPTGVSPVEGFSLTLGERVVTDPRELAGG
ncbi:hypothetical protein ACQBAT_10680 [Ornithinimicrobium sp. Y1847]|uniref:hypothetical protein n=1 Tax=Ornithinimicrobium sp. Y1847 TaxID=3405419 RepID=UPI003B66EF32